MKAVIQRVSRSSVAVDGSVVGKIGRGVNILLGVLKGDRPEDIEKMVSKIVNLRIFPDESGKMNRSLVDIDGEALVISQFTLAANLKRGRRPSFDEAMEPSEAKRMYELFCDRLAEYVEVKRGVFGAMMEVEIVNDGPVTFIVDSRDI